MCWLSTDWLYCPLPLLVSALSLTWIHVTTEAWCEWGSGVHLAAHQGLPGPPSSVVVCFVWPHDFFSLWWESEICHSSHVYPSIRPSHTPPLAHKAPRLVPSPPGGSHPSSSYVPQNREWNLGLASQLLCLTHPNKTCISPLTLTLSKLIVKLHAWCFLVVSSPLVIPSLLAARLVAGKTP